MAHVAETVLYEKSVRLRIFIIFLNVYFSVRVKLLKVKWDVLSVFN